MVHLVDRDIKVYLSLVTQALHVARLVLSIIFLFAAI
jgi:hypothetical protein